MKRVRKYLAFVRIGAVHAAQQKGELYGRVVFVGIILGVFSALWRAVAESGIPLGLDRSRLVWYLAATEWVLLSAPPVHVDIEAEIRRGDVTCQLQRPFSYLAGTMAQGLGMILVRAPLVAAAAFACAFALTGRPPNLLALVDVAPFGLLAMALILGLYIVTGLTAFWLDDVTPLLGGCEERP